MHSSCGEENLSKIANKTVTLRDTKEKQNGFRREKMMRYSGYGGFDSTNDNVHYDDFNDEMSRPNTNCSRFERRHDFSTFNMADYSSCENCRHMSADNRCIVSADTYIGRME